MSWSSNSEDVLTLTERLHHQLNHVEIIVLSGAVSLFNKAISYLKHVCNVQQTQENKLLIDSLKLKYILHLIEQDTEECMVRSYIEEYFPLLPKDREHNREFLVNLLENQADKDEFYSADYYKEYGDYFMETLKRDTKSELTDLRKDLSMNENKVVPDSDVSWPDANLQGKPPQRRAAVFANSKMNSYFSPNVNIRETTSMNTEIESPPLMLPTSSETVKNMTEMTTSTCHDRDNSCHTEVTRTENSPVDKLLHPGHLCSIRNSTHPKFLRKRTKPDSQFPRKQTKHVSNHTPYSDSAVLPPSLKANSPQPVHRMKLSNYKRDTIPSSQAKTTMCMNSVTTSNTVCSDSMYVSLVNVDAVSHVNVDAEGIVVTIDCKTDADAADVSNKSDLGCNANTNSAFYYVVKAGTSDWKLFSKCEVKVKRLGDKTVHAIVSKKKMDVSMVSQDESIDHNNTTVK